MLSTDAFLAIAPSQAKEMYIGVESLGYVI